MTASTRRASRHTGTVTDVTDESVEPRASEVDRAPYRVIVVCLGNICRSPTAEAVLLDRIERAGLSGRVEVDSAGTGGWHVGQPADSRAVATLRRHGYATAHRARQIRPHDFADFDLILAADGSNLADLQAMARTPDEVAKVHRLRSFDPAAPPGADVPDPYYDDGFDEVLAIIEAACDGLVARLVAGERPG